MITLNLTADPEQQTTTSATKEFGQSNIFVKSPSETYIISKKNYDQDKSKFS